MAQEAAVLQPIPFPLYNWAGFHQVNSMLQPGRWISSATQATARKGSIAVRKEAGTLCGASWSGSSSGLRPPPHRGHPHLLFGIKQTENRSHTDRQGEWKVERRIEPWKSDADSGHRGCLRKKATTDPCPASWSSRKRKSSSVRRHGRRSSRPASLGAGPSCWWGRTWPVAKMQRRVAGRFGEREGRAAMAGS
uniref:Uncharacterized protein n=1 Tax=Aegilops tauschii subsp. strangulata TaxID=200361 RepID=A0A453L4U6_AEGTS